MAIATKINYASILDEVLATAATSGALDVNQRFVGDFVGAGQVMIADITLDGLGDYDRANSAYPTGTVAWDWKTHTLQWDRGKRFTVDRADNEENAGLIMTSLMSEFTRVKVAPEVDALRYSYYQSTAGTKATVGAGGTYAALDGAAAVAAMDASAAALGQVGIAASQTIAFMRWGFYNLLKSQTPRSFGSGQDPKGDFETYDDARIIKVPDACFTVGATKSATDGFIPGAKALHMMRIAPSAVTQVKKHENTKTFTPDENQVGDGWLAMYRLWHGAVVPANKVEGLYALSEL